MSVQGNDLAWRAILPAGAALWHSGGGSIGVTFVTRLPEHYASGSGYSVGGVSFAADTPAGLDATARDRALQGIQRLGEIARLGFVEVAEPAPPANPPSSLVSGLGGARDFGEITLPRSDDGYFPIDITAAIPQGLNVFGTTYTEMFVNTNGSVSFGNGVLAYTPRPLDQTAAPMFAAFWADVDTRAGARAGRESGEIHVDLDRATRTVTVTWDSVNFHDRNGTLQNSFQIQILDRGGGDFNLLYRYGSIDWTTGDQSGGVNGLGGRVAVAGVAAGDFATHITLPASGVQARMRQLDTDPGNTGEIGIWQFRSRDGVMTLAPALSAETPAAGAEPALLGEIVIGALPFGGSAGNVLANGPGSDGAAGDVWINRDAAAMGDLSPGGAGHAALIAALARAVGLSAPDPAAPLPAELDNRLWTVLSDNPVPGLQGAEPVTPMLLDIQALQIAYGANMDTRTGDDVYFGPGSDPAFAIADGGRLVATIWDAGGNDTFSAANQSGSVVIDLRPGMFSRIGAPAENIAIARAVLGTRSQSAWIENAVGGAGRDRITGNKLANTLDGGTNNDRLFGAQNNDLILGGAGRDRVMGEDGDDTLHGGADSDVLGGGDGADRLDGGAGDDFLSGGAGADVFILAPDAGNDRIRDWEDGIDRIDLSALAIAYDALTITNGAPGRVRVDFGAGTLVVMDQTGLLSATDISAEDFFGLL
ncbi:MAG: hypothetical protein KatS3mg118_0868 [Paracoccaceae bacterium]|nr:MAG: hypothetical protein KatS3mg118_0868 [Paracoccaceae bacterium]